jgi:hypothetical protein
MSQERNEAGWALASRLNKRMIEHPKRHQYQGAGACQAPDGRGIQSILLWGHPEAIAEAVAAEGVKESGGRVWSW